MRQRDQQYGNMITLQAINNNERLSAELGHKITVGSSQEMASLHSGAITFITFMTTLTVGLY